ncbi:MAG: acriflavin resistance protein, partial [Spirochaetes bacterium GWD1_27_9]
MLAKEIVKRPVTLFIVFILLIGLGVYASLDLAVDLYPEINPPVLLIFTDYEGTGPEEIEKTVTRPMESVLSNVGSIKKLTSVSSEGSSQITLEFTWGTDMTEAANDVRDKIDIIKKYLPDGVSTPMIFKFDPAMIPILYLIVQGNRSSEELRKISEDIIQPRLEQVEGVAMAGVSGGRERLIRVEILQNRLEAYNLTLTQISNMLRGQNVQISAGTISEGNKNYLIRTAGEYTDIEQIKNTVIAYKNVANPNSPTSQPSQITVRLRDIANVYDGLKKEESAVYVNGNPAVYITIQKQTGSNSVKTADSVRKRLIKIENEVPKGIKIDVIRDTTTLIKNSLNSVVSAVVSGALLAVLILFLFLRSFKSVVIIGVSIPISVIITLMLMYFFHLTLNMMTLAGLALGIGMLVDNSIVILENIYRYREKGAKHTIASILGSQEMMTAISASTFTTICVFAPLIMFKGQLGMVGELFSGLAFTVVISLTCSLIVAVFLVPILTSKYLQINTRMEVPLKGVLKFLDSLLEGLWDGLSNGYKSALSFVLKHRLITILVIAGIFIGSFFLIPKIGFEFMPTTGEDSVEVSIELPVGTKLEITKNMMVQIEQMAKSEVKGYKDIIISSGEKSFFGFLGGVDSHKGSLTITLPEFSGRIDDSTTIKQKMRKHFNDFPSAIFSFKSRNFGGSASPIDIIIKSNDLNRASLIARKIRDLIKDKVKEVTEPAIDMKDGLPQIEIMIDRDRAYSL